jgi:dGTPase
VDNGLRSGLITLEQLNEVPLVADHLQQVRREYPNLSARRVVHETIRRMINTLVGDVIESSGNNIKKFQISNLDDVRNAPPILSFSKEMFEQQRELKKFLLTHLYRHYKVMRMSNKAQRIISDLFSVFMEDARLLPPQFQAHAEADRARAVADYIAGMTDRYAIREHRRIFAVGEMSESLL